ncbi:MAG: hypothetical protein SFV55_11315 [Haliscomenobacter sp.]|uniref:hypothetical protein n=1 Tax=Haliscomenobacter sp. TaxID=2717303 RepID=UPI0029A11219|nr:hypothetical protein [Haliscomenobacter sp.]MDX2069005.1 hypothetical protein [Haliscomenobacter sp.]
MIRIAIIEFSYHAELLNSLGELFSESNIEVTFYISLNVYQSLSSEVTKQIKSVVLPTDVSLRKYFQKVTPELNGFDLVVFNTVADQYAAFRDLSLQVPTILRIHNVHASFAPFSHIYIEFSPYFIWKAFSYLVRRQVFQLDWYYQFKFLKKINYFSFLTRDVESYAQKWVEARRIGPRLPAELCKIDLTNPSVHAPDLPFHIVIPGEINKRKRDYHLLYRALAQAANAFNRKVRITLLGKPRDSYGRKMIELFETLSNDTTAIVNFNKRVSENDFESAMHSAHLIVAPVKLNTTFAIYREYYGLTKISGAQSDAIRYGKPLLIPAGLNVDSKLSALTWKYKNETELIEHLINLVNTNTLNLHLNAQIEGLSHFTKKKLLPRVTQELTAFLKQQKPI